MESRVLVLFSLIFMFTTVKDIQAKRTKGKGNNKTKPPVKNNSDKPSKHHPEVTHNKHEVSTVVVPSSVSSLLPLTTNKHLISNKLRKAAAERIHRLMNRHPLNVPLYNKEYPFLRPYFIQFPEHFRRIRPFTYHQFYRRAPWFHSRYRLRYPSLYALMTGARYGSALRGGFRHYLRPYALRSFGVHRRFPHRARYAFASQPGLSLGQEYVYSHDNAPRGNWKMLRLLHPYLFHSRFNQWPGKGPETRYIEESYMPSKVSKADKISPQSRDKGAEQKVITAKRLRAYQQTHHSGDSPSVFPFGFRIQRYQIRLIPLKKRTKNLRLLKKPKKSVKKSKSKHKKKIVSSYIN